MRLRHVGIVVKDMPLCRKFWTEVCGFEVQFDGEETGFYLDMLLNKNDVKIEVCKLRCLSTGVAVELIHPKSHSVQPTSMSELSHGITHVAITVDNLVESLASIERFTGSEQPRIVMPPNGDVKVAYARGPENIILELVELVSKSKNT